MNSVPINHWFESNSIVAIPYALSLRKFLKVFAEPLNELSTSADLISASLINLANLLRAHVQILLMLFWRE